MRATPLGFGAPQEGPASVEAFPQRAAIEVRDLSKSYGGVHVVTGLTLTIEAGLTHAIIGPNGAGKTTLFKMIAGETTPTSGEIRVFGQDVTNSPAHIRTRLGVGRTFQITSLFPHLSVRESMILAVQARHRGKLAWWAKADRPGEVVTEAESILEGIGLAGHQTTSVGELAYGRQRQLELGIAMAAAPRILLLDEPGAGLAGDDRERMKVFLAGVAKSVTVVLVDHDMDLVTSLSDRIICLDLGTLVDQGTPEDVAANEAVQRVYLRPTARDAERGK